MKKEELERIEKNAEEKPQASKNGKTEVKKPVDCRDNCMHCGNHCIYLKK